MGEFLCPPIYTHSQRPGLAAAAQMRHENFIHIKIDTKLYFSRNVSSARVTRRGAHRGDLGLGQAPLHPVLPPTIGDPCPLLPSTWAQEGSWHRTARLGCRRAAGGAPQPTLSSITWSPPPQGIGDTSPVPSMVAAGVMGFHALHTEGLSPVSLGRGAGGAGGRKQPAAQTAFYRESSPTGRARRAREARGAWGNTRGEGSSPSLRQRLQDGIHFLGHGCQCELKLVLGEQRKVA